MSVTRDPQDHRDPGADDVTPDAAADDDVVTTDEVAAETTDDVETARPDPEDPVDAAEPETPAQNPAPRATTGEASDDAPDETGADAGAPADEPAREHDVASDVPDGTVDGDEPPAAGPTPVGEEPGDDPAGAGPRDGADHGKGGADAVGDPAGDDAAAPDGGAATADTTGTDAPAPAEPPATTGAIGAVGRHGSPTRPEPRGLRGLGRALRPRASRSQIVVGVLCALLGFALVVQVSQTQEDQLSSLRQSDLVRLLDDVTQRSGELEDQVSSLESTRDELQSGSGRERAALELAEQQAETLGILSGRLPAEGPGVEIEVVEGAEALDAFALFNVLEELRNAGAEAMEVNGVRLVASSYFEDSAQGVVVDGQTITSPYRWNVIGDPSTLETALEIPGGAMASLRADGARTTITQQDRVEVAATVEPGAPQYATPVPADE
ncbi:DUF881 domain-containing protein [Cellulosimicrobium cellulans]|uniref:DUF881 domain-containing protein n=1 Tax=Cellulosimicrobium cellulans TaxID=1710 RepID=UPI0019625DA3|nr:DUF881 domain-containing protein [Cellulosimicrobium cellulans]MBN0039897.1 DUF881 domain-containing protein [Cellulosimicrobium cellulans]